MVIFVMLTLWLGNWQTRRAEEKQALQARIDERANFAPLTVPARLVDAQVFAQHRVEVRGTYLNERTVFIDNRVYRNRPGYHVITPMKINGSGILIAINRGWVPADPRREILPRVPAFQDEQTVRGVAVKPLERAYELSGPVAAGPVKQNLALDRLGTEWGMPLQPVVVQQTGDVPDGLVRDWARPDTGADTHRAYALQWYVMSIAGLVLWIVLNLRKNRDSRQ